MVSKLVIFHATAVPLKRSTPRKCSFAPQRLAPRSRSVLIETLDVSVHLRIALLIFYFFSTSLFLDFSFFLFYFLSLPPPSARALFFNRLQRMLPIEAARDLFVYGIPDLSIALQVSLDIL